MCVMEGQGVDAHVGDVFCVVLCLSSSTMVWNGVDTMWFLCSALSVKVVRNSKQTCVMDTHDFLQVANCLQSSLVLSSLVLSCLFSFIFLSLSLLLCLSLCLSVCLCLRVMLHVLVCCAVCCGCVCAVRVCVLWGVCVCCAAWSAEPLSLLSVCTFKTPPYERSTRPHVQTHAGVLLVHTKAFWICTRRFFQHATSHTNTRTPNTHTHTHTHTPHTAYAPTHRTHTAHTAPRVRAHVSGPKKWWTMPAHARGGLQRYWRANRSLHSAQLVSLRIAGLNNFQTCCARPTLKLQNGYDPVLTFGEPLVQMTTPHVALICLINCLPSEN